MKAIFGLVCASALVLSVLGVHVYPQIPTVHQTRLPVEFAHGKSYVYAYNGRLTTTIAQLEQNAAAVLEIASDIVMQPEQDGKIALQMTNVRVGKHNGQMPEHLAGELNIEHQEVAEYERELSKPIRFVYVDGQIKAFEALPSEEEWSINIKKSILSLLNVNLVPERMIEMPRNAKLNALHEQREYAEQKEQMIVYPLYEDGIGGICETVYEIKQVQNPWSMEQYTEERREQSPAVWNVTKTRNYQNCLVQPTIEGSNVDIRGAPVACLEGKNIPAIAGYYPMELKPEHYGPCKAHKVVESPVEQYQYVKYNISQRAASLIEGIWAEGKTVLTTAGKPLMVLTQQNMTLTRVHHDARELIEPIREEVKVHEELSFRIPKHGEKIMINGKEHRLDIPYFHLFGKINFAEIERLIPAVLNEIAEELVANEISVSDKKTMQKIVQLNNAISVLDLETLERLFVSVAGKGKSVRATAHEQVVRKLFIDLIGTAGTTQTALLAKRLFEKDMITTMEAKELFEAIPQNLFLVDYRVIEEYLNLFLSEKVQQKRQLAGSVGVAFGKLIQEATAKRTQTPGDIHAEETVRRQRDAQNMIKNNRNVYEHQRVRRSAPWEQTYETQELIKSEHIVKVVEVLKKALREAHTFHQKVVIIETLAHMAIPEALEVLAPIVNDKAPIEELPGYYVEKAELIHEERNFVRQVTIYALAHVARQYPQLVLPMLLPVYENIAEPYEVRIAAFTIALQCQPSKPVLERIASELHREHNRQVRSFVVSGLETAANLTQPMYQEFAEAARFAVEFAPKERLGVHYSKMTGKDFFQPEQKFGLNWVAEWVASNVSAIPRSGYFTVGQTRGPFKNNLVEFGYNAKGIETILERLFEKNTLFTELFQEQQDSDVDRRVRREPRSVDVSAREALEILKQKLQLAVRTGAEPKATVFMKMFERTSYMTFDRQYINELIDTAEEYIKDLTASLMQGKSFHYVKVIMPNQLYKVMPSEMGLPIVITERQPIVLSLKINKAKLQLDTTEKSLLPTGANLTVQMVPALYHAKFQFAYAVTPATHETIGVQVEKITRAAFPMELSFGLKKNQFTWSFVPTIEQEVFHHQTKAHTFVSKLNLIAGPKRDWLGEHIVIKTQPQTYQYEKELLKDVFGLGFKVQVETENPVLVKKPFFRTETAKKHGLFAAFVELIQEHRDITPREVHITLESDKTKKVTGFDFAVRYARVEDLDMENKYDENMVGEQQLNKMNRRQAWIWQQKKNAHYEHFEDADRTESEEEYVTVNGVPSLRKVFESIFGMKYQQESIKKVAHKVIRESQPIWKKHWTVEEEKEMPAIVAHNWVMTGVARSVRPIYYGLNAMIVKSYDERTFWAKLNGFRHEEQIQGMTMKKSNPVQHKEICLESVISYPTIPDEFYYEPTATQDLKAIFNVRFWTGANCDQVKREQTTGPKVTINGELQKVIVPEFEKNIVAEPRMIKGNERAQAWYKQQCEIDRANGQSLSFACEKAILDDSYFKRFTVEVEYENVHPIVKNLTRKLALATKVALYDELEVNERLTREQPWTVEENKIRITGQFNTRVHEQPILNVLVESPKEIIKFHNIRVPFVRPISALYPITKVVKNIVKLHEPVDKCIVMENFVRTFDNVTVRLNEQTPCQYLVAKDCSAEEKFAIFARQLNGELKTKAVTILAAGSEIRLLPPTKNTKEVQVVIDGETVVLRAGFEHQQPKFVAKNGGHIIVYLREPLSTATEPIVVLKVEQIDLLVKYDGKNVKVEVGHRFKGQLCGVCGDNNDEAVNEFAGPDGCFYKREQDFVASYAMRGEHCSRTPVVEGPKRCPAQVRDQMINQAYQQHYQQKKNVRGFNTYQVDLKTDSIRARLAGEREEREVALPITNKYWSKVQEQKQQQRRPVYYAGEEQYQPQQYQNMNTQQQFSQNQQQFNKFNGELERMRTHFIRSENQICFSNQPVRACIAGVSRPVRMVAQSVNFHCLPAQSVSVQRLIIQAEQQVLEQFARKPVHMTEKVMLPLACVA